MLTTGISIPSKPEVGEIHTVRISLATLFGSESNFDAEPERSESSSSSSSASSSSSKKSHDRPKPRPCVIWKNIPTIQVLLMSRFDGVDVTDPNIHLFNHLTNEYVLKRLVAVSPKPPYGGRRAIFAATSATNAPMKTVNTNLILIPAIVPKKWKCKIVQEYFLPEELHYINGILRQIGIEESEEQSKCIQAIDYPRPPPYNDDNVNDEYDNTSSSASSSIPKTRREFVDDIHWEKNDFVNHWLDHLVIGNPDSSVLSNNSLDNFLVDNPLTVSPFDHD